MFLLETPNIRLKHLDICYKSHWGQRSPKVIQVVQGHLGSLSEKKLNNCNSSKILNFFQHLALANNQRKSSDHSMV